MLQHGLNARLVAVVQQAGFAAEQALGAAEQVANRFIHARQFAAYRRLDDQLAVLGHDLEAVVEDRHSGVHVQGLLALDAVGDGRGAAHLGQTEQAEQANP